ncbi:MAG: phosphoribosyltransferase family protein [Bacteroidota bacterium]
MTNRILGHQEITHKINRIAFQIYEANVSEKEIVVVGITGGGLLFAQKIAQVLQRITEATITLGEVSMDKTDPLHSGVTTSLAPKDYQDKSVVLIDDVLKSGTTLIYGVYHFLQTPLRQLKTAVLVNRNHKKYPVKADYKGISLSTSLHEHVFVDLASEAYGVYLS